ncbi:MAG: PAS domain S-box protein [Chloroherpetonaceae bacterium]|nr:PAS domain S-box protein [Chloroherpetonaceae bacterium]
MLNELRCLIPDEALRAKILALFEEELAKRKELHTVETLRGEAREKVRLQEEFRKNADEKFRIAAELAGDYIYEATINDGKIRALYASEKFSKITGYSLDDINSGNGWLDFIHPDDLPAIQSILEAVELGRSFVIDYRIRRKDGGTIWIRDFSQPILDGNGRYVKSIGVSRNITAEKEAELALVREQQFLNALFNTVPMGICLSDRDGTFLRVNQGLADILGYGMGELLGKHFSFIVAEEHQELAKEAHRMFMEGESMITSGEWLIRRKDGEKRWVQITARKFQREDGRWFRVTATQDITRKRQEEEEKTRLLELLARTESLARIGSWELDLRTNRFTKWSDELFRIHERPIELGPPTAEEYRERYISPETNERLIAWLNGIVQTGRDGDVEIPIVTHLGNRKTIYIRGYLIFQGGVPNKAQGMTQDVTREKTLEKQKEELAAQLLQAQKMEAIGTLAGGLAHEFNNILSGMLGNVRLLEQKFAHEPRAKKYIDRLLALNQRAATIVSQMMGFARKGKYELKPISLRRAVDNVLQILLPTTDRRIRFHLETSGDVPLIQADPVQIEQVILNLAKNAIDAIEPLLGKERERGHVAFRLGYEPIAERFRQKTLGDIGDAPMVLLEISDNGMGIPEEIRYRIFEPFFTTKPIGKGTGLGLPMVYGIVENHDGFLFLESEVGKGTSFFLYFPAVCDVARGEAANATSTAETLSGARVLAIDDEPVVREILAEHLRELGAEVEVAETGEAGIEKFRAMPKENLVVILDLNMPDLNGEQVLQALMAIDERAKVIVATGYLDSEQTNRLKEFGATSVLTKPLDLDDIVAEIALALRARVATTS